MAKITPYQVDLANRLVGTPGINPAAGKAAEELAGKTNQLDNAVSGLSDQEAHQAAQQAGFAGGLLGSAIGGAVEGVAHIAAKAIAQHEAKVRQQQQALNKAHVAVAAYKYADDLDSTLNDYKQQHINDPENIPPAIESYIQQRTSAGLDQFTDPLLRAQAEEQFAQHANVTRSKARAYSLDAQTKQLEQVPAQVTAKGVQAIANAPGDLQSIFSAWQENAHKGALIIGRLAPQLGDIHTQAALDNHDRQLSKAAYTAAVANRPDDPIQALQQIGNARTLLKGNLEVNASLTPEDRKEIEGSLNAAEDSEVKNLRYQQSVKTANFSLELLKTTANLDLHRDDPEAQNKILNWAPGELENLKSNTAAIENDKSIPDAVKAIWRQADETQAREIDALVKRAHVNLRYQDTVKRQGEAEARRLQAEQHRADMEAKRQAGEELRANKTEAQTELNSRRDDLKQLILEDPIGNREAIIQGGAQVMKYAAQALKAGHLTPAQADRATREAMAAATLAANKFDRDWSDVGGHIQDAINLAQHGFNKQAVKAQRRTEYISQMKQLAGQMDDAAKMEQSGAAMNLSPQASEYAAKQLDIWSKQNPNASAAIKQQTMIRFQQIAGQAFPAAAKPRTGDTLTSDVPAGYNGNIDITKRTLVLHPGGHLDASNSTEAARKEEGGRTGGDYGTEYSMRFTDGDHEVSVPTIYDGKLHSRAEAVAHYRKTGQYLGKWPVGTPESVMDEYETRVHSRRQLFNGREYKGPNGG